MKEGKKKPTNLNTSFATGAIALVFLIIGYQVALFVHKAALTRIAANRDHPDTVYVVEYRSFGPVGPQEDSSVILSEAKNLRSETIMIRKESTHSPAVKALRGRSVENFRFNPNTVSVEDLQRLGFSEKQAQSIENYRLKGGRFRRKTDFSKSYVVADSVYDRLEPYIDIPLLDINRADSLALLDLPGIGPYFAGKVVAYRGRLGGFSHSEQLMEIYNFTPEKYDGLKDLITCSRPEPYPLWTLPETDLALHPHISKAEAHGIVLYREHNPPEACTLEGLKKAGVLSPEHASRLELCLLAPASPTP